MKKNKSFSLVEIMTVCVILSILCVISILSYEHIRKRVYEKSCVASMRAIYQSIEIFRLENKNDIEITMEKLVEREYLKKDTPCPLGGKYMVRQLSDDIWTVICPNHGDYLQYTPGPNNP